MKPKKPNNHPDLFRSQLSQIINLKHPLVKLAHKINWERLEQEIDVVYSPGSGQPPLPTRLLAGLHYLKYTFNESDESVVARWVENPYWQYFCGFEFLQHELPLHPTTLIKWRKRVDDKREALLQETIKVASENDLIKASETHHVNVDTTVQEKNITFPTDAKLYQRARELLVKTAQENGIKLRQTYLRVGKKALIMQGRYSHARQMKRAAKQTRKLKTYLRRVIRDIQCKCPKPDESMKAILQRAWQIHDQQRNDKNKIYSVYEDAVFCIAKGKVHKKYEFGNKVSIVSSSKNNWILSALSFDNPFDGHTLKDALAHCKKLTGKEPKNAYCDGGYKGHEIKGKTQVHLIGKIPKRATKTMRKWMKRRAAVEPIIGHIKSDHRMNRNFLKGDDGNRNNALLAAAAFNFAKLLKAFYWVLNKFTKNAQQCLIYAPRSLVLK